MHYHVGTNLAGYLPQESPSAHNLFENAILAFADVLDREINNTYQQHENESDDDPGSHRNCTVCDSVTAAESLYEGIQRSLRGGSSDTMSDLVFLLGRSGSFNERIENGTHTPVIVWIEIHEHTTDNPCLLEG